MGIEEQIDRLIDLGEDIKSRLDRLVEMASDHFAGADKMVADEPAKEPAEPEYREPVLPADLGKWAEFSHDGINWMRYKLRGCHKESESSPTIWSEKNIGFRHCRIKKDA